MITSYGNRSHQSNSAFRRQRVFRRVLPLVLLVSLGLMVFFCTVNKAEGKTNRNQSVTSVYIEKGDSLWSIASEYYTEECGSMKKYIKTICEANNLSDETIHAGNYIIVPYYH